MKEFKLTKEQDIKFEEWRKKQLKKDSTIATAGERWTFCFTPTGLGTILRVVDEHLKDEIDLTEWEHF